MKKIILPAIVAILFSSCVATHTRQSQYPKMYSAAENYPFRQEIGQLVRKYVVEIHIHTVA